MNTYILPTLVAGLMLVGIGLAMNPVDQASAVHTTIQANTERHFVLTGTITPEGTGADEQVEWDINQPFEVVLITTENTVDAATNCNLNAVVITTNLVSTALITEADPAVADALNDSRLLTAQVVGDSAIYGTGRLAVSAGNQATCAAGDTQEILVVIKTTGALTAAPIAGNSIVDTTNLAVD